MERKDTIKIIDAFKNKVSFENTTEINYETNLLNNKELNYIRKTTKELSKRLEVETSEINKSIIINKETNKNIVKILYLVEEKLNITVIDLDKTSKVCISNNNIIFNFSPEIEILVNDNKSLNFTLYQDNIDINELYRCELYTNLSVNNWSDISLREKVNIIKDSKSLDVRKIKLDRINLTEVHSDNSFPNNFIKLKVNSQIIKKFNIATEKSIGFNELKYFFEKQNFDFKLLVIFFLYIFCSKAYSKNINIKYLFLKKIKFSADIISLIQNNIKKVDSRLHQTITFDTLMNIQFVIMYHSDNHNQLNKLLSDLFEHSNEIITPKQNELLSIISEANLSKFIDYSFQEKNELALKNYAGAILLFRKYKQDLIINIDFTTLQDIASSISLLHNINPNIKYDIHDFNKDKLNNPCFEKTIVSISHILEHDIPSNFLTKDWFEGHFLKLYNNYEYFEKSINYCLQNFQFKIPNFPALTRQYLNCDFSAINESDLDIGTLLLNFNKFTPNQKYFLFSIVENISFTSSSVLELTYKLRQDVIPNVNL